MLIALIAGTSFGLLNLAHCASMCGPLSSMACARAGRTGLWRYHAGRVLGYSGAGALSGHIGEGLGLTASLTAAPWVFALLTASACLVVAHGLSGKRTSLLQLRTKQRRNYAGLIARILPKEPLSLGVLSALLPCGLLAAALLSAVATGSGPRGAALMFGFANSTGLAVLGSAWLAQVLPARGAPIVRRGLQVLLVVGALVAVARPALHASSPATHSNVQGAAPRCH